MPRDPKIRMLVQVGFYRSDIEEGKDAEPYIIGAIDRTTVEIIPVEEEDAFWRRLQEEWLSGHGGEYEFRTVDVALDRAELKKLIQVVEVTGEVEQ